MRRYLIVILSCFLGIIALVWVTYNYAQEQEGEAIGWRSELKQIDDEIKRLQDLKNRHLAAAVQAQDEGMRWQFLQNQKQEAKRAFEREQRERETAELLQKRIDALSAKKAQILREHSEANELEKSS